MKRIVCIASCSLALFGMFARGSIAADPTTKCQSAKLKESAKYASCRLRAEARALRSATTPDFSRCEARLSSKLGSIESNAGIGVCPSEGDAAGIDAQITRDVSELATLLADGTLPPCDPNANPSRLPASGQLVSYRAGDDGAVRAGASLQYADNGDGTITDLNTGLMWEKLSDDGTIHDRDTSYTWTQAFDVKIAALNAASFAGYGDWRLPNVKELQSIIAYSMAAITRPAVDPVFDTGCVAACSVLTCSCAASESGAFFWTSTTVATDSSHAWVVYFHAGDVYDQSKDAAHFVRAVRGGS